VARACIEGFATGLAAPHWKQDELDALEHQAEAIASGRYSAHAEDFRKFTRANRDFHRTIVELSANRFLVTAWETLKHDELVAFTSMNAASLTSGRWWTSTKRSCQQYVAVTRRLLSTRRADTSCAEPNAFWRTCRS
jgi:DNA-binding GntR family transcriptional regulator